jgi:hypothetical protein
VGVVEVFRTFCSGLPTVRQGPGVAKVTLYLYFLTKEALFECVLT